MVTIHTSADYPSGFYKYMRSKAGALIFLQGAIGGWVQPEHVPRKKQRKKGTELAQAVLYLQTG